MIETATKYIKHTKFQLLENWSVQYLIESTFLYNPIYKLVKIGDFLRRNKTAIEVIDTNRYKRVTIRTNNGGVYLRDIEEGRKIGTKNQFLVKKGQFLLSKIDARNGAFGVVPEEVDGAIITGNFWTFDVDFSKINPHFLALLTTTPEFIKFSENASNGTTNRHYLQEDLFLNVKIPLPTLEEQNQIVAAYNKRIAEAEKLEKESKQLEEGIESYVFSELSISKKQEKATTEGLNFINYLGISVWGADRLLKGRNKRLLESGKYKNELLSSVAFINPKNDLSNLSSDSEMSFIPMECISDDYGEVTELRNGIRANSNGYTKFIEGDLLWARITPCMQNGKSAIVKGLANGAGYGSTEYHVIRQKQSNVIIEYIYHLLRLKPVLEEAVNFFTGSAGQQRVPKYYLENLVIPIPPIEVQLRIDSQIKLLKGDIKNKRNQAKTNRQQAIIEFESKIFMPCN
jgi:type I restriction enzyme S subunit